MRTIILKELQEKWVFATVTLLVLAVVYYTHYDAFHDFARAKEHMLVMHKSEIAAYNTVKHDVDLMYVCSALAGLFMGCAFMFGYRKKVDWQFLIHRGMTLRAILGSLFLSEMILLTVPLVIFMCFQFVWFDFTSLSEYTLWNDIVMKYALGLFLGITCMLIGNMTLYPGLPLWARAIPLLGTLYAVFWAQSFVVSFMGRSFEYGLTGACLCVSTLLMTMLIRSSFLRQPINGSWLFLLFFSITAMGSLLWNNMWSELFDMKHIVFNTTRTSYGGLVRHFTRSGEPVLVSSRQDKSSRVENVLTGMEYSIHNDDLIVGCSIYNHFGVMDRISLNSPCSLAYSHNGELCYYLPECDVFTFVNSGNQNRKGYLGRNGFCTLLVDAEPFEGITNIRNLRRSKDSLLWIESAKGSYLYVNTDRRLMFFSNFKAREVAYYSTAIRTYPYDFFALNGHNVLACSTRTRESDVFPLPDECHNKLNLILFPTDAGLGVCEEPLMKEGPRITQQFLTLLTKHGALFKKRIPLRTHPDSPLQSDYRDLWGYLPFLAVAPCVELSTCFTLKVV